MNRFIYSVLLYLLTPLVILRLLWRSRQSPAYRKRWSERFGFIRPLRQDKPVIWVHSVSVGETIASQPLVQLLMKQYPNHRFLITTMTPTGSDRVKALYGNQVEHLYVPYDLPCAQRRFFDRIRPAIAIIIETELWPNTIATCHQRNIPIIIANARLSERSAKGYGKLGNLTRNMLNQVSAVACHNQQDGHRFIRLGLPKECLQITGSIKFDITVPEMVINEGLQLRALWESGFGRNANIFIAASTHDGEEQPIFDAYKTLKQQYQDLLLVLVPRHPERFEKVYELAGNQQLVIKKHSQQEAITPDTNIILGDTMGELMKLYAASDIAFVGGSLIERGGHNVLEPVALGKPVITGSYVFNFQEIVDSLKKANGLIVIENSKQLAGAVSELLQDNQQAQNTANNGRIFIENNRGAVAKQADLIQHLLA